MAEFTVIVQGCLVGTVLWGFALTVTKGLR